MTRVLFFARARELAGTKEVALEGATVAEVIDTASARFGDEFAQLIQTCTVVVDGDVVMRSEHATHAVGSELAILPPVSGGSHDSAAHDSAVRDSAIHDSAVHDVSDGPDALRVAVLTVSDRASAGTYVDETGPAVEAMATELLRATIVARQLVPDEEESIAAAVRWWCDEDVADVVLTNGGTGLGPRDVTPEATRLVLHAEAPGFGELMRSAGLAHTPLAALSRQAAGRRGRTIVVNLPGSVKGATESLGAIAGVLGHAVKMARS